MNYCRSCQQDFGSVSAFDAHRTGKHAYTLSEGLRQEPPVEDGRRCLNRNELSDLGWKQDQRGRWRTPADTNRLLQAIHKRPVSASRTHGDALPAPKPPATRS